MPMTGRNPKISVIIPTYNRDKLLRGTLLELTRQTLPADEFEVIVADDGSSDRTREVVDSFSGQLQMGYHFQEDLGFRVATARNEGARLATAPVLCFIDSGVLPGPDFLRGHLAEHSDDTVHAAVIGYMYGYNPVSDPLKAAGDLLGTLSPAEIVARFGDDPAFADMRHRHFIRCGFDLNSRAIPWNLFFSGNCSVRTSDFWDVGGFDSESFTGWGGEDVELGFRLYRRGLTFQITRDGWVIDYPHERPELSVLKKQHKDNLERYVRRTPEPVFEIGLGVLDLGLPMYMSDDLFGELNNWSGKVRDLTVAGEIAEAVGNVPAGSRIAVLGCGGVLPASLPPAVVMDFDRGLLDQALAAGRHVGYNSIGLRTPLADRSVDTVIITSRLSGLWERWHEVLTREAQRIGRRVISTFGVL
jgi:glycosyltransferase involved in cell wall biosynthesis